MTIETPPAGRKSYLRFSAGERVNHWLVAISAVLLILSGLALFHPAFWGLTELFGGGPWTRVVHPWIGVVMFVAFTLMFLRMAGANVWSRADTRWLCHLGDVIRGREDKVPEAGRFNAAQKLVFWVMVWSIVALFASGLVLWHRYFGSAFSIEIQRWAGVVHGVAGVVMILTLIVHVYAAIWVKGSVGAMTRGTVSGGWLWRHHRAWLRQTVRKP